MVCFMAEFGEISNLESYENILTNFKKIIVE